MQDAHDGEENPVEVDKRLELFQVARQLGLEHEDYHLRQSHNPRHKPGDHEESKWDEAVVVERRGVNALAKRSEYVSYVMQVSYS